MEELDASYTEPNVDCGTVIVGLAITTLCELPSSSLVKVAVKLSAQIDKTVTALLFGSAL